MLELHRFRRKDCSDTRVMMLRADNLDTIIEYLEHCKSVNRLLHATFYYKVYNTRTGNYLQYA